MPAWLQIIKKKSLVKICSNGTKISHAEDITYVHSQSDVLKFKGQ